MLARCLTVCLCALLTACATTPLPPRTTLPANLGQLPLPKADQGVLVIDVSDGPTRVQAVNVKGAECTTPCALALPLGPQTLQLRYGGTHRERTSALVLPEPQVLKRDLQRQVITKPVRHAVAVTSFWVGQAAMLAAVLTAAIGRESHDARSAARGLAGGGGALFVLSIPLASGTAHWAGGGEVQFPLSRALTGEAAKESAH